MLMIRDALQSAKQQLEALSDSANLDAQILLQEVLEKDRAYLLAHPEDVLTDEQQAKFAAWVNRRSAGEPVAYIIGRRAFYDREIAVAPGVLIPRPETELLLEQALAWLKTRPDGVVVDVGTGSGALAVTLKANVPNAAVYATDISPQALMMARYNAFLHGVQVEFYEGNLLEPLLERGVHVNVVMANLPYIAKDELPTLEVSRYEPRLALDGGVDGLNLIRANSGALVLLEIGADQGEAALELTQKALSPQSVEILKDYAGHDRIVKAVL
jgi:release factor glutamine methyltransferase